MGAVGKPSTGAFITHINDIFILMGAVVSKADTMACAHGAEMGAGGIIMKGDADDIPEDPGNDGQL